GQPSHKRTYNQIPLQIYFALLPAYVVYAWSARRRWARAVTVVLVGAVLAVYAINNMGLIMFPAPAVYGTNVFDGLIELRQRFPDRRVVMVTTREDIQHALGPEEMLQLAYRLLDQ